MIRYSYENWIRYALGVMAFAMALLLTPRALIEVAEPAGLHEIPVNLLENPDECLWCTPPSWEPVFCDEPFSNEEEWLHPDAVPTHDTPCVDTAALDDRSA
jgi:hypothetical protein